jgi:triacylglycerol lipase
MGVHLASLPRVSSTAGASPLLELVMTCGLSVPPSRPAASRRHSQHRSARTDSGATPPPELVGRCCSARGSVDPIPGRRVLGDARKLVEVFRRIAKVQASEVALMASFAAKAPLQLIGAGAQLARCPLPPARPHAEPLARPVLLVHGFCGTQSSWSLVAQTLSARGLTVDAIAYTPFGTSVARLADRLVAEVNRILSETHSDKVHLVGHSLGGVVIAKAIADGRLDGLVDTVVTLGSPFGGSPWANLLPFGEIPRALREGSPLLRRLASAPPPDGVRWLAFTAELDIVVPGLRSVPAHTEVESITIGGVGHLGMLLSRRVVERIADALPPYGAADPVPA